MCVEVYATYVCMHTIPMFVPCSTFSLKNCPKYQRQHRNRPLRCSCTCKAPVSLTEALQDSSFSDGLAQAQLGRQLSSPSSSAMSAPSPQHRARDSMSPVSAASSSWSGSPRPQNNTLGSMIPQQQQQQQQQQMLAHQQQQYQQQQQQQQMFYQQQHAHAGHGHAGSYGRVRGSSH